MVVDSSALPEQVIDDVVLSAFDSAGQRCSALRVLFVQADVAPRILRMLTGAMAELNVGDPGLLATDVGPVIDDAARDVLRVHAERMKREATMLFGADLAPDTASGSFFAPHAFEIDAIGCLDREVFGAILHAVRRHARDLALVIDAITATRYGLTHGLNRRVGATARHTPHPQ